MLARSSLLDHHKARLQHRFQQAIKPCHLVAYTLHPAYQGEGLTAEYQEGLRRCPFPDVMIQLHSVCASSASIERVCTTFGHIHSKIRNRLGVESCQACPVLQDAYEERKNWTIELCAQDYMYRLKFTVVGLLPVWQWWSFCTY
jgi:hypothetical protein